MRADLQAQVDLKVDEVRRLLSRVGNPVAFGHAFIWGCVPVFLKNGKKKLIETCIGSVCTDDLEGCLKVARSHGIENPWYNMD